MSETTVADSTQAVTRQHIPGFGAIYRRPASRFWWIELWNDGKAHRESSKSTDERKAIRLLKQRHAEIARDEYVEVRHAKLKVADLLALVESDYKRAGNRSLDTLGFRVKPLKEALGHIPGHKLTVGAIERYVSNRLEEGKVSRTTVNRELAALRRAYNLAVTDKLVPVTCVPRFRLFSEANNARQGFVEVEEFTALVRHLPTPLDDVVWFAYRSGWRRREILSLTWADVDATAGVVRLRAELSKNKDARELPITAAVGDILKRREQSRLVDTRTGPKVCDLIFHRGGQPIRDFRGAWEAAVTAIGRPNLLLHDLRRSAVRNMVNAGVPERVAMKVTGHKTRVVFDRYHIVSPKDVREALERTEASLGLDPHTLAVFPHSAGSGHPELAS
jgi:integrase